MIYGRFPAHIIHHQKDDRLFLKHDRVFKKDDRVFKKRGHLFILIHLIQIIVVIVKFIFLLSSLGAGFLVLLFYCFFLFVFLC